MSRVPWERRNYPVFVGKHYKAEWDSAAGDGMADHPKYNKAKNEAGVSAALSVVKSCLSHAYLAQMKNALRIMEEKGFEKPVLVAPYRKDSKNMLARTAAAYLGEQLGLEVDTAIVELPGKKRKGMDKLERFFNVPAYGGEVKKNKAYIAVDDMITTGGTLSELRSYIDSKGGRFLFSCVLASPDGKNTVLNPQPAQTEAVYKNLGQHLAKWFENASGLDIKTLTNAETMFLGTKAGKDTLSRGGAFAPA
ncbi:MAG: phosphoribosyltransferase [Micavibrio sp.]